MQPCNFVMSKLTTKFLKILKLWEMVRKLAAVVA